ncbi:hypothetical protein U1872_08130 [Sphingomonas sp. RB3P16]|uniref:hypothetical protein n=1 Tax=Parasphingomonas frigoris TaxID=3096163 RepID=UPI002FC6F5EC
MIPDVYLVLEQLNRGQWHSYGPMITGATGVEPYPAALSTALDIAADTGAGIISLDLHRTHFVLLQPTTVLP